MKNLITLLLIFCIIIFNINTVIAKNQKQVAVQVEKTDSLKLFIITKIQPFYNADFDTLVTKTSSEQLQRDKSILQFAAYKDSVLTVKIAELEEYHNAKISLSQKYNKQQVYNTIKLLNNKQINGKETDRLKNLLENYGGIIGELRILIEEINKKKRDPNVKDRIILSGINEKVFMFLYPDDNGNLDMSNYPLVFDICNRILKSKREDLDGDILELLREI
jgi:hypothetical protein